MQDPTKKIAVELSLQTDKFNQELKGVAKSTPGLEALGKRLGKQQTQSEKKILDLRMKLDGPQASRKATQHNQKALKSEQLKLAVIKQQTKEAKNLNKELQKAVAYNKKFNRKLGGRPTAGGLRGAAKMLGGMGIGALVGAAGAAIGAVTSQVKQGYGAWSQYRQAQGALVGTNDGRPGFRQRMDEAKGRGVKRGYMPTETMQQALMAAKATGQAGSVTTLQDLTRTIGMDTGGAAGIMGQLTRGGAGGFGAGGSGKRDLEKALAAGFESGLDRARMPEFIQGVGKLVEMQGGRQGGDVSSTGFATILGAMGKTGKSGMQGSRGAAVLSQLNEAMVKPGGGEYGQALMLQAMGFGKPGGDTTYYEALKKQERGATDPENVKALFGETERQYGGGQEQILALREMTGLSITQLETMRTAVKNFDNEGLLTAIEDALPLEEQSLAEMKGMGDHLELMAGLDERMVGIGAKMAKSIEGMQKSYNIMIDQAIPLAQKTLEAADGLLWAFREHFGMGHPDDATDFMNVSGDSIKAMAMDAYKAVGSIGQKGGGSKAFNSIQENISKLQDISHNTKVDAWNRGTAAEEVNALYDLKKSIGFEARAGLISDIVSNRDLGLSPEMKVLRQKEKADILGAKSTPGYDDDIREYTNIDKSLLAAVMQQQIKNGDLIAGNADNQRRGDVSGKPAAKLVGSGGGEITFTPNSYN